MGSPGETPGASGPLACEASTGEVQVGLQVCRSLQKRMMEYDGVD